MNTQKIVTKAKKPNPNIKDSNQSKLCARDKDSASKWLEDYKHMGSLKLQPVTEWFISRLALDLIAWSDDESEKSIKQIRINQFLKTKKIPRRTFYDWCKKYEDLKDANEYALLALADKRESGAAVREYAENVLIMMPKYDPEWKEIIAWKASLKDQSNQGNVTIVLPDITTEDTQCQKITSAT